MGTNCVALQAGKTTIMKLLKKTVPVILVFGVAFASQEVLGQELSPAEVKIKIESKTFVFQATSALPTGGRTRQFGANEYDVKVTPESVVSYLPYFGRAYTAPIGGEGGIKFTSTNFEYTPAPGKKESWDLLIKPKDYSDVQQLFFTISKNGYTTLQVISSNRQPISFYGYIK
jgi:hypothetical protein